jgi:hypothetical protein
MPLSSVEESLLVASYYRGGSPDDRIWTSNADQVVTLSFFYTGDISSEVCIERFSRRGYVGGLYQEDGKLIEWIETRYRVLIELIREHPELMEGGGDLETPADPTFTACRLTVAGLRLACSLVPSFRQKPEFPDWPDRRTFPSVA